MDGWMDVGDELGRRLSFLDSAATEEKEKEEEEEERKRTMNFVHIE